MMIDAISLFVGLLFQLLKRVAERILCGALVRQPAGLRFLEAVQHAQ